MADDTEYPKTRANGSGSNTGYTVEARNVSDRPQKLGDQIFDNRWRQVAFNKGEIGVPSGLRHSVHVMGSEYLLEYSSAQALRWWLHANADFSSRRR